MAKAEPERGCCESCWCSTTFLSLEMFDRNRKSSNMENQLWIKSSFPSCWAPGMQLACSLWWITCFPGRALALLHIVYGQKQAARTNFSASPHPSSCCSCCCCCFSLVIKGFLTSSLLPKTGAPAVHGEQLEEVGPKHKERGGGKKSSSAKGPPSFPKHKGSQPAPSLSRHSLP